ncbi:hypothetical protein IE364_000633 [Campylobacter jejuni]|nr:hypothetical protein [Campylobacter jejuni]
MLKFKSQFDLLEICLYYWQNQDILENNFGSIAEAKRYLEKPNAINVQKDNFSFINPSSFLSAILARKTNF